MHKAWPTTALQLAAQARGATIPLPSRAPWPRAGTQMQQSSLAGGDGFFFPQLHAPSAES